MFTQKNDYAFRLSCVNGHIDITKWSIGNFPNINVHAQYHNTFIKSCGNGYLNIAKWLIEIYPDINIHIQYDNVFIEIQIYGSK